MADVNISKFRASVVREGSRPATPGFVVSEGQSPTDPAGSGQNHLPVTIAAASTGLSITESQILSGAGTVSQYIRGDGSLADFPEASGGGSSISYYLNGSVNQGTIGGVAYKELNKVPILGAGTDFSISADGYIASFLTDAGDPNLLEIPGGNWNFETYFSSSSSGGTPTFYVELYKYDGTTFTLIASNSSAPEFIAFGTTLTAYFSTLAVPTTTLALTDRLAVRYYVTHSGRTITMHTENNHLCQIITTFTTGLTALNGLTAQVQSFAVGTTGTDFNIASATATHTFNLPTASATNRGALSSSDWTTFNNKQNALGFTPVPETRTITINGTTQDLSANRTYNVGTVTSVAALTLGTSGTDLSSTVANGTTTPVITLNVPTASASNRGALSSADWSTFNGKQNALTLTTTGTSGAATLVGSTLNIPIYSPDLSGYVPTSRTITINGTTQDLSANRTFNVGTVTSVGLSSATSGVTIGSTPVTTSGTITLAIATASGSQNGLLSSTDWTTFNSKQNALTNPVTGTGTTNYLAKFTGLTTVGNSQVFDNGTNVGIGTIPSSWASTALQINNVGLAARPAASSLMQLSANQYWDGSNHRYISSNFATIYTQNVGGHNWSITSSGTANDVITWTQAMTLTSGGNLILTTGTISDNGSRLQVTGNGTFSLRLNSSTLYVNSTEYTFANFASAVIGPRPASDGIANLWLRPSDASNNVGFALAANSSTFTIGSLVAGPFLSMVISGGAATFSSSVTATSFSLGSGNGVLSTSGFWGTQLRAGTGSFSNFALLDSATNGIMYNPTGTLNMTFAGNVGIGTSNPQEPLHISTSGSDRFIRIENSNAYTGIWMNDSGANSGWLLMSGYTNTTSPGDFAIREYGVQTSIVIKQTSGNVLIGTTTDIGQRLQVSGGYIAQVDGGVRTFLGYDGTGSLIGTTTNNYFRFITNDTERMRITSGGNVGINTGGTINYKLHINTSGTAENVFGITNGTQTLTLGVNNASGGSFLFENTNNGLRFGTNGTERVRIDSVGNVGIGTASPTPHFGGNALIIQGTSGSRGIMEIWDNSGTGGKAVFQQVGGDTYIGNLAKGTGSGDLYLTANGTTSALLKANGNLLIGSTTDNGSKLQVNGAIRTAQPVGTTSNGWLLGRALVSGTSTPNRWIRVQIGLEYYDILAVYMGTL